MMGWGKRFEDYLDHLRSLHLWSIRGQLVVCGTDSTVNTQRSPHSSYCIDHEECIMAWVVNGHPVYFAISLKENAYFKEKLLENPTRV